MKNIVLFSCLDAAQRVTQQRDRPWTVFISLMKAKGNVRALLNLKTVLCNHELSSARDSGRRPSPQKALAWRGYIIPAR